MLGWQGCALYDSLSDGEDGVSIEDVSVVSDVSDLFDVDTVDTLVFDNSDGEFNNREGEHDAGSGDLLDAGIDGVSRDVSIIEDVDIDHSGGDTSSVEDAGL